MSRKASCSASSRSSKNTPWITICWWRARATCATISRSEEHTSELQSPCNLVCRLLLEKKKNAVPGMHRRQADAVPHPALIATAWHVSGHVLGHRGDHAPSVRTVLHLDLFFFFNPRPPPHSPPSPPPGPLRD